MSNERISKRAALSDCGTYRYDLRRTWNADRPPLTFMMLNPSTADAEFDDPTIRRCIGFAKREGAGGLRVVNFFALRATDPKELRKSSDPFGPNNLAYVEDAFRAGRVVAGWGADRAVALHPNPYRKLFRKHGLWCLGRTKAGAPRHPLYLKSDAPLEIFIRAEEPSHD